MTITRHDIEPGTIALFLTVPRNNVVLLQAYFDLHEGIGTVRTLDHPEQIVRILTTEDQYQDCCRLLLAVRNHIRWAPSSYVPSASKPDPDYTE
jgi:hypothetical protein